MKAFVALLFVWTLAMLGLHLASRPILRRALKSGAERPAWLNAPNVVRFEGLYYVALLAFWWAGGDAHDASAGSMLAPILVLMGIHLTGWVFAEAKNPQLARLGSLADSAALERRERILLGIQFFDLAEAVVLAYIAWKFLMLLW